MEALSSPLHARGEVLLARDANSVISTAILMPPQRARVHPHDVAQGPLLALIRGALRGDQHRRARGGHPVELRVRARV